MTTTPTSCWGSCTNSSLRWKRWRSTRDQRCRRRRRGARREHFKRALAGARERIEDVERSLEHDLRKQGKVVDAYVRDNAWGAVAIAAAVAFVLGAIVAPAGLR